jgi:hypothetical protein
VIKIDFTSKIWLLHFFEKVTFSDLARQFKLPRLTIRKHFAFGYIRQVGHPSRETRAKLIVINDREDGTESIVGRNAVNEPQLLGKPILFGEAEFFDINPVIGPTNHGAEGDEENILRLMLLLPIHSRVLTGGEMMRYRRCRFCGRWKSNRYCQYLI